MNIVQVKYNYTELCIYILEREYTHTNNYLQKAKYAHNDQHHILGL